MSRFSRYIVSAALLLCWMTSCIYPFEADVKDAGSRVVIEGDILIGQMTEVRLSHMVPLGAEQAPDAPKGTAWVEDSQGGRYESVGAVPSQGLSIFEIDTRTAPSDREYRLHVRLSGSGKEYVSGWKAPEPAPSVDGISFMRDADSTHVHVALSAHSEDGCQYFRWNYRETWKYHADFVAQYAFQPSDTTVVELQNMDYSTYWCWNEKYSSEIDLCATTELTSDRLVNHKFLKLSRSDNRFQERYRIVLELRTISADAYRYLSNLKLVSDYTGSLFSANPSDVVGNITCVDDPQEHVIGYVDVGLPVKYTAYLDHSSKMYVPARSTASLFIPKFELSDGETYKDALYALWKEGYIPILLGPDESGQVDVLWEHKRCVDCRTYGGSLKRPSDWEDRL